MNDKLQEQLEQAKQELDEIIEKENVTENEIINKSIQIDQIVAQILNKQLE